MHIADIMNKQHERLPRRELGRIVTRITLKNFNATLREAHNVIFSSTGNVFIILGRLEGDVYEVIISVARIVFQELFRLVIEGTTLHPVSPNRNTREGFVIENRFYFGGSRRTLEMNLGNLTDDLMLIGTKPKDGWCRCEDKKQGEHPETNLSEL